MIIVLTILIIILIILLLKMWQDLKQTKAFKAKQIADATAAQEQYDNLIKSINDLNLEKVKLYSEIETQKKNIDSIYESETARIQSEIERYKDKATYAAEEYVNSLKQSYTKAKEQHDAQLLQLEADKKESELALDKIRQSLSAGVQAKLRQQEKRTQLDFYKLNITDVELQDIQLLENVKLNLHNPVILSKLIWSTYFQKQTNELCNRVVGVNDKCGIYKITNINTEQVYIGQSVSISSRWKQHIKCGLGIDAPATNKLYNSMQKDGVWNFSFEVLEECPKDQLNEKEAEWINMYQSDKFGYNSTKGNKS